MRSLLATDYFFLSLELVFQRPRHQALDRGACALAFVEHRVNLARYRHLDAAQLCQKFYGSRRAHALSDLVHAREHLVELPTATEFVSDVAIAREAARACQHEVAEAREARQRFETRALGQREPRHLGQAPRGERRHT